MRGRAPRVLHSTAQQQGSLVAVVAAVVALLLLEQLRLEWAWRSLRSSPLPPWQRSWQRGAPQTRCEWLLQCLAWVF
jgi:hypothetical protein